MVIEGDSLKVKELTPDQELVVERNLVWVFGSSRGGTTWLGSQLLSYQTKIMFEPRIARFIGDRRNWIVEKGKKIEKQSRNPDYIFSEKTKNNWRYFLRKLIINRIYFQFPDFNSRIVIKEPLEKGGSDVISECLPNSRIILLIRDGRDIIDSKIDAISEKKSWGTKALGINPLNQNQKLDFIRTNAIMWNEFVEDLMRTYENHSKNLRILVRYENLRKNTLTELQKIYDFLEIDITKEELENLVSKFSFENIPSKSKGKGKFTRFASPGMWKKNFNEEEKKLMKSIMEKSLTRMSYEL